MEIWRKGRHQEKGGRGGGGEKVAWDEKQTYRQHVGQKQRIRYGQRDDKDRFVCWLVACFLA